MQNSNEHYKYSAGQCKSHAGQSKTSLGGHKTSLGSLELPLGNAKVTVGSANVAMGSQLFRWAVIFDAEQRKCFAEQIKYSGERYIVGKKSENSLGKTTNANRRAVERVSGVVGSRFARKLTPRAILKNRFNQQ